MEWGHKNQKEDRWHIICWDFLSRRVENLVSRVAKREEKRSSGLARRPGAIHLGRTGGRDREIS
jgi:hypothetical protein